MLSQSPNVDGAPAVQDAVPLTEIMKREYSEPPSLIEKLLKPSEVTLFVGRQKEGKSTLALQLAIDVATDSPFLSQFKTYPGRVLYVDFENREAELKKRGLDLAQGRNADNVLIKSFDFVTQRDVGLFGKEAENLATLIARYSPELLVIDPLRFAAPKNSFSKEEVWAVQAIDAVSRLREGNPAMAVIIVHHTKKKQNHDGYVSLIDDPRTWIEYTFGSQALLAHVDNIWGLELNGDGFVFATVPRSHGQLTVRLEKQPDSERFLFSSKGEPSFTSAQQLAWQTLPDEFGWREATEQFKISNNTLDRVIRQAQASGFLDQDPATKRYRKVKKVELVGVQ